MDAVKKKFLVILCETMDSIASAWATVKLLKEAVILTRKKQQKEWQCGVLAVGSCDRKENTLRILDSF